MSAADTQLAVRGEFFGLAVGAFFSGAGAARGLVDATPGHGAIGGEFGGLVEGVEGFAIPEAVEQDDGLVEVALGFGRGSGYGEGGGADVRQQGGGDSGFWGLFGWSSGAGEES